LNELGKTAPMVVGRKHEKERKERGKYLEANERKGEKTYIISYVLSTHDIRIEERRKRRILDAIESHIIQNILSECNSY
jgi:hypothetical protein